MSGKSEIENKVVWCHSSFSLTSWPPVSPSSPTPEYLDFCDTTNKQCYLTENLWYLKRCMHALYRGKSRYGWYVLLSHIFLWIGPITWKPGRLSLDSVCKSEDVVSVGTWNSEIASMYIPQDLCSFLLKLLTGLETGKGSVRSGIIWSSGSQTRHHVRFHLSPLNPHPHPAAPR